jgi:hypothetical protein
MYGEKCILDFGGDPREGDHLEEAGTDGRIIPKLLFRKCDGEAWTGLIWLRIGTGDELSSMR